MSNPNQESSSMERKSSSLAEIPYIAKIVILYTSSNLLALALYWYSVFPPLALILFGDSNFIVGLLACAYGMMQLLAAFVSGYVTDKNPLLRPKVLFAGACAGLVGISTLAIAVSFDWVRHTDLTRTWEDRRRTTLPMWIAGSSILGLYQGFAAANVESVIAAVIPKGKREPIYATKVMFETLSGVAGCLVTLILFLSSGNEWSVRAMSIVIMIGLGLHLIVLCILVHLSSVSDKWMTENYETVVKVQEEQERENKRLEQLKRDESAQRESDLSISRRGEENNSENNSNRIFTGFLQVRQDILPYFVCSGDLLVTLGSGMTVRFLMLFLIKDYNCSPVLVICITFVQVLLTALFVKGQSFLTSARSNNNNKNTTGPPGSDEKSSPFLTRIQGIQLARFIGPIFVLWLALPPIYENHILGALVPTLIVYTLRQPAMNCATALSRSLIMDCVPSYERARWNAVESLTGASWSGSALIGGIMSDRLGYRSTFLVTTGFHALAFLCVTLVSRTKEVKGDNDDDDDEDESETGKEKMQDDDEIKDDYGTAGNDDARPSNLNGDDDDENEEGERRPLLKN